MIIETAEEMTARILRARWRERMRFRDPYHEPDIRAFQVQSIRNIITIMRALRVRP